MITIEKTRYDLINQIFSVKFALIKRKIISVKDTSEMPTENFRITSSKVNVTLLFDIVHSYITFYSLRDKALFLSSSEQTAN